MNAIDDSLQLRDFDVPGVQILTFAPIVFAFEFMSVPPPIAILLIASIILCFSSLHYPKVISLFSSFLSSLMLILCLLSLLSFSENLSLPLAPSPAIHSSTSAQSSSSRFADPRPPPLTLTKDHSPSSHHCLQPEIFDRTFQQKCECAPLLLSSLNMCVSLESYSAMLF